MFRIEVYGIRIGPLAVCDRSLLIAGGDDFIQQVSGLRALATLDAVEPEFVDD
jgi:hypothetical protein